MNKADEALQAVQRSNEAGKLKKDPPTKHLKEGNYARADYFEARVKELELEVMALQKEKQDFEAALMEARDLLFSHTPQSDPVWEDKRGAWADGLHNIGRSQSDGARSRRPFKELAEEEALEYEEVMSKFKSGGEDTNES